MAQTSPRRTSTVSTDATVKIEGLAQLRRELRALERQGDAQGVALLKAANKRVADHVVGAAQRNARNPLQRKAFATYRSGNQLARAVVTGGRASMPFIYGAEFGAKSNQPRNRGGRRYVGFNQFLGWKKPGNGNAGYGLFPAMRDETRTIIAMYRRELDRVTRRAFPD